MIKKLEDFYWTDVNGNRFGRYPNIDEVTAKVNEIVEYLNGQGGNIVKKFQVVDEDNLYFGRKGKLVYRNSDVVGLLIDNELITLKESDVEEVI